MKYSDDLLKRLLPAVKNQALSAADRLGIQQDLFALAKAGLFCFYLVLKLLEGIITLGFSSLIIVSCSIKTLCLFSRVSFA